MSEKDRETNYIDLIKPSILDDEVKDKVFRAYCWRASERKRIYLHLQMEIKQINNNSVLFITSNLDSTDVRGQGKHLWNFLKKELQNIADGSVNKFGSTIVMHQVSPNEYSQYLLEGEADYIESNGKFYAGYEPN